MQSIIDIFIQNSFFNLGLFFISLIIYKFWYLLNIYDVPNNRSSHITPTPTAAGLFFVIIFNVTGFIFFKNETSFYSYNMLIASVLLGFVSFIDDLKPINHVFRFIIQILSVIILAFNKFDFGFIIIAIAGICLINACNFMDGINGFLGINWLLIMLLLTIKFEHISASYLAILLTVIAFLLFNTKGKIFMADVGSTFLGLTLFNYVISIDVTHNYLDLFYKENNLLILGSMMILYCADILSTLFLRLKNNFSIFCPLKDYGFHFLNEKIKKPVLISLIFAVLNFVFYVFSNFLTNYLNCKYCCVILCFLVFVILVVAKIKYVKSNF